MVTKTSLEMQRKLQDISSQTNTTMAMSLVTDDTTEATSEHASGPTNAKKRTRKAHNKVRTGCLTCKIRRKKCDETKPACLRCTSTGRKCDGYVPQLSTAPKPTATELDQTPVSPRSMLFDTSPSACSRSESLCHQAKRTKLAVVATTAAPVKLLPKPIPISNATMLVDPRSEMEGLSTSPTDSSIFADSTYGSLDHEYDKSEEEELEDFILSYRKPMPAAKASSSAIAPVKEHSIVSISTSSNQSIKYSHPPPSGITFEKPAVSRSLFPYGGQVSEIERHCFTYFRYRTGPSFSSYFDSSMWRTYAVSAALAHPVVLSCAAACGAAHRRWGFGISREAFEYCAHADKLHKKAFRGLEDLKKEIEVNPSGMGAYDRDVIMTSEMLLGMFQGFQGEYQKTVTHMNNGIKQMLGRPMTIVHSETRYCAIASKPTVFCQLFKQLDCRAFELFKTQTKTLVRWGEGNLLPPIPTVFKTLEEARDLIFTEVDWIMNAPARVWQDREQRSDVQDLHVRRLLNWSVTYANTIQILERTPQEKKACMLLKLVRNAAYLLLHLTLFVTGDLALPKLQDFDMESEEDSSSEQEGCLAFANKKLWEIVDRREELSTNLERVKILAEDMLDDNGVFNYDEHSVSFDSAIGPPKCAAAGTTGKSSPVPEASEKTRHLVKRLMQKKPNDSSLWEMLGVYGVAERISAVEEHAVIDAVRGIIPESIDPKWVDITCMMESRRVLLRYCRPDDYGLGMMWTQEWWAF